MNIQDIFEYLFHKMNIPKVEYSNKYSKILFFEYSCIFLNIYLNIQCSHNALINIQLNIRFIKYIFIILKLLLNIQKNISQNKNIFLNILFGEINISISSQIFM